MKLLIFTLFLLTGALADPISTDKGQICEQSPLSNVAETLAAQAKAACGKTNFSPDFCEAYNACMGLKPESGCTYAEGSYKSALNQSGGGSCGLTAEELAAIYFYTGSGYGCLNSYLRNPEGKNPKIENLVKVLDQGLGRLPRYRGFVNRGSSLPEKIRELHKQGAEVDYAAYTSTSTSHGFSGSDMFLIYSERGRPIMNFSGYKSENEVLFASRTKFRVITVKSDGTNRYVMREVIAPEDEKQKLAEDARIIALAQKQLMSPPPPPPKPKPNWVASNINGYQYGSSMYVTLNGNGDKTVYSKNGSGPDVIQAKYLSDKTFQKYTNGEPDGKPVPMGDKKDPLDTGYPICGPEAAAYVAAQKGEDPSKPKLKCFASSSYGGGGYVGGSMGGNGSSIPSAPGQKVNWVEHPGVAQTYISINEKGETAMYSQNSSNDPPALVVKYLPDNTLQSYNNGKPLGSPAKMQEGFHPLNGGTPICGPGAEKYVAKNGGAQPSKNLQCFTNTNLYQSTYAPSSPADSWKCPTGEEKVPEVVEQINLPSGVAKFFPTQESKP